MLVSNCSDDTRFSKSHERTIFIDGLQCAAAQLDADEFVELGHPDALGMEVW